LTTPDVLKKIYKPIDLDLRAISREIRTSLWNSHRIFIPYNRFIFDVVSGGKKIRPALVLLSAGMIRNGNKGARHKETIILGTAVELVHTASLVHDDIIDAAELRRGKMTINKKWDNHVAILIGDYLYSKAFHMIQRINNRKVVNKLIQAGLSICLGELAQVQQRNRSVTPQRYMDIIENKTASLLAACCETSAVLNGAPPRQVEALKTFGLSFGIAFQLIDDCLDVVGKEHKLGKSLQIDRRNGEITFANPQSADSIVQKQVRVNKSFRQAQKYLRQAIRALEVVPSSAYKESLIGLIEFVFGQI